MPMKAASPCRVRTALYKALEDPAVLDMLFVAPLSPPPRPIHMCCPLAP